jgi:hypothetical protein
VVWCPALAAAAAAGFFATSADVVVEGALLRHVWSCDRCHIAGWSLVAQFDAAQTALQRAKPKRKAEAEAEVEALREKLEEALRVRAALGRRVACLLGTLEAARAVLVTDTGRALTAAHALVAAHSHAAMRARLADWPEATASLRVAAAASASDAAAAADFSYGAFAAARRRHMREADAAARAAQAEVIAAAAASTTRQASVPEAAASANVSASVPEAAASAKVSAAVAPSLPADGESQPSLTGDEPHGAAASVPSGTASAGGARSGDLPSDATSTLATAFDVSSATVDASAFCSLPVASMHAGLAHTVATLLPAQPLISHTSGPKRLAEPSLVPGVDRAAPPVPPAASTGGSDLHSRLLEAAGGAILPSMRPVASPSATAVAPAEQASPVRSPVPCIPVDGADGGAPPVMPDDPAAIAEAVMAVPPGPVGSVVHPYTPQADDELRLEQGQLIAITSRDTDGWWLGRLCAADGAASGPPGRFPFTYLQVPPLPPPGD